MSLLSENVDTVMSQVKVETSERPSDVEDENDFYDAVEDVESSVKAMKIGDQPEAKAEEAHSSSEDECQDCGACPLPEPVKQEDPSEQAIENDDSDQSADDQEEATSQKKKVRSSLWRQSPKTSFELFYLSL